MLLFIFVEQGLEFARKSFARTRNKMKMNVGRGMCVAGGGGERAFKRNAYMYDKMCWLGLFVDR